MEVRSENGKIVELMGDELLCQNPCPKCGGTVVRRRNASGSVLVCLNCGEQQDDIVQ